MTTYALAGSEPLLTGINVKTHFSIQHRGRSNNANFSTFVETSEHIQMQIYFYTNVLIILYNIF